VNKINHIKSKEIRNTIFIAFFIAFLLYLRAARQAGGGEDIS
jgi:hypothetical protein